MNTDEHFLRTGDTKKLYMRSLSLSLSHTHTHTHSLSLTSSLSFQHPNTHTCVLVLGRQIECTFLSGRRSVLVCERYLVSEYESKGKRGREDTPYFLRLKGGL